MGLPSDIRDFWRSRSSKPLLIASPAEDQRILQARNSSQEAVRVGSKAAAIAFVASAVPTLVAVRVIPWAKANINYTGQALIVSAASIAAYFIAADQTILESARKSRQYDKTT